MKISRTAAGSAMLAAVLLVGPAPASQELAEFEAYKQQTLREFEQYKAEYLDQFDQRRQELMKQWGRPLQSDADTFVDYSDDLSERTVVDFASDTVEISIIHDADDPPPLTQAVERLQRLSGQSPAAQQPSDDPLVTLAAPADALLAAATPRQSDNRYDEQARQEQERRIVDQHRQARVALEKQADLAIANGSDEPGVERRLAQERARVDAHESARLAELKSQYSQQQRHDPSAKVITTYRVKLPEQSLSARAARFLEPVQTQSNRWRVAPELIFAIMKAESSFNPRAKSHIPAFGLMQIVPASAGRDVNDKLLQRHGKPTELQLFHPSENIQYGTAYLHLLNNRYLKRITDPRSRLYCTIAAYNTGAGNVARAFNTDGSRNIIRAATEINRLTPEQVFDRLQARLPYDETKVYLDRVVDYHQQFAELGGTLL